MSRTRYYISDIIHPTRRGVVIYTRSGTIAFIDNDGKAIMRKFKYHYQGYLSYFSFRYKGHTIWATGDDSVDYKYLQL